ncbi:MAG: GAF domain-containing protein, partial [Anaerolineae bacterium]
MTSLPTEEIDFLYIASNRLTSAVTPQEQLSAVSDFARLTGAAAGQLFYIDHLDNALPETMVVAAEWTRSGSPLMGIGHAWGLPRTSFARNFLLKTPAHTVLVSDAIADDRVDAEARALIDQFDIQAFVILPMNSKGRWIGMICFVWDHPRKFNRRDDRVYQALLQQIAPVVDSVRLLGQIRDRYHAEQEARRELEMLYEASAAINAASTLDEILKALSVLDINSTAVGIAIYDQYDRRHSEYVDIHGMYAGFDGVIHERVSFDDLPIATLPTTEPLVAISNLQTDTRVDAKTREFYSRFNVGSVLIVPLMVGEVWIGGLTLLNHEPQDFSAQDQRLAVAIGKLVSAALDRLRLQQATEKAMQRAELLARVTAALSKATDEDAIMNAVALYTQTIGAETLIMLYGDVYDVYKVNRTQAIGFWQGGRSLPPTENFRPRDERPEFVWELWKDQDHPIAFVEDIATDPRLADEDNRKLFWTVYQARAMAVMILYHGQDIRGLFTLFWSEPHRFNNEERTMLTQILQTLSAVVASRRSYLSERERASQLEAVAEVSAVTTGILKEDDLLNSVELMTRQRFNDFSMVVFLVSADGTELVQRTNL